jgi:hypothetical protein
MNLTEEQVGLPQNPLQDLPDGGGIVDDKNIQQRSSCHSLLFYLSAWLVGQVGNLRVGCQPAPAEPCAES